MNDLNSGAGVDAHGRAAFTTTGPLPVPPGPANILIVDDRADKRLVFSTILDDLKQNIVAVESGDQALRWLLENECAVILLDVNMPGMDGLETAELIRSRRKTSHTPIIFITAFADEIHTARGYSLGAVDYILSPVMPNVLRSKVRAFVQLYNMNLELRKRADERVALAREQAARLAAEQSQRRANFLAEIARVMGSSLDVGAILKGANRLMVPFLADRSDILLERPDGVLVDSCASPEWDAHAGPRLEEVEMRLNEMRRRAIEEAAPVVHRGGERGGESVVVFPLVTRGAVRGTVVLALVPARRPFDDEEISLGENVADRVASAVDNCFLYGEIQDADRRKNEFLATLSHELRNPLAPMRTALELMRSSGVAEPARAAQLRDMMERQVNHMTRLVEDLLDVSRITRGAIELRRERLDVGRELRQVAESCHERITAARHELALDVPPAPLMVDADCVRLHQIFENLLMNAVKYTEPGGRIAVRARRVTDEVEVSVTDTGIGISAEQLPSVWGLFVQVDDSAERTRKGLGIGLALVKDLVTRHGGSVNASSPGLGRGSTFTVRLPVAPADAASAQAAPPPPLVPAPATLDGASADDVDERPLKVLVVDDNVDAAETLSVMLELLGQETDRAHDGPAAIAAAERFRPALMFLDIGLPGLSGTEVARRIRANPEMQRLYMVALSGYGTEQDRLKSIDAGFDTHLTKPLDPAAIPGLLAAARARTAQAAETGG